MTFQNTFVVFFKIASFRVTLMFVFILRIELTSFYATISAIKIAVTLE